MFRASIPVCSGGMLSVCTDHATGAVYCGGGNGVVRKVRSPLSFDAVQLIAERIALGRKKRECPDVILGDGICLGTPCVGYGFATENAFLA